MDFGKIKVDRSWANVLTVALVNPMYLEPAQVLIKGYRSNNVVTGASQFCGSMGYKLQRSEWIVRNILIQVVGVWEGKKWDSILHNAA